MCHPELHLLLEVLLRQASCLVSSARLRTQVAVLREGWLFEESLSAPAPLTYATLLRDDLLGHGADSMVTAPPPPHASGENRSWVRPPPPDSPCGPLPSQSVRLR